MTVAQIRQIKTGSVTIPSKEFKVFRTYDVDVIASVIRAVWDEINDYNCDFDPATLNPARDSYMLCTKGNNVAGIWLFRSINPGCFEIHALILKPYRRYAKEAIKALYEELRHDDFKKLIAIIPTFRKHVYRFAKQSGFKDEGLLTKSFCKDNLVYDQWVVGLTKEEMLCHLVQS